MAATAKKSNGSWRNITWTQAAIVVLQNTLTRWQESVCVHAGIVETDMGWCKLPCVVLCAHTAPPVRDLTWTNMRRNRLHFHLSINDISNSKE